jgi:hypothetical protein
LHQDVANFITKALEENLTGIYNLAASSNVTLGEVSECFQRQVEYGNYHYVSGDICNKKASEIYQNFNKSSLDTIKQFIAAFSPTSAWPLRVTEK